jgi:nitrogen-specific signal transduction histidine kinase/CheY-like chemotaxis protein
MSKVSLEISGEQVVFAIGRDVTEQTRERAQLMTSDRMASVGILASGVAHEINNPLAAVLANLDIAAAEVDKLVRQGAAGTELQEEIKDAREAAERVRQVARDLKIFSRAEDDNLEPIDLNRVLESSLRMAWTEIRHRARLVRNYGDVPPVMGNESRLGQAFLNLIVNAAQAIQEGAAESNEIRVTLARDGADHVLVEIADTGAGIPPEVVKKLFTPFFTTKAVGIGTGLGLSICRRIITAAGGEISVDSRLGVGTTFRVRLPAAQGDRTLKAPPPPEPPRPTRHGRVLIIDDEPIILRALDRILGAEHQITAVTSAQKALELIGGGERFDVILCDLMMPQMTGIDLHAALITTAPEQARRMVFVTGGAFTARGRSFLDEVPNPRVEKPFDAKSLRALIERQISGAV